MEKNCINSITECGATKIPQGRIVGGNTTFEKKILLILPTFPESAQNFCTF